MKLIEQKTIGVLGGSSDQATAEYYRLLNAGINQRLGGWNIAETVIAGMNFGNIEHYVRHGLWAECEAYMASKVDNLIAAGADVVLCVSNTLHRCMEPIMARTDVGFIHIADPTGAAIRAAGLRRVALLGTKPVMATDHPRSRYEGRFGLDIEVPTDDEQDDIDRIIFDELCRNIISADSRQRYLEIIDRMIASGSQGVILGCTEIFLLVNQSDRPSIPIFNTTELHVAAAVDFALDPAA